MATYWTLEYGGVEKTLADWGFGESPATLTLANMAKDILALQVPGALITDNPIIPFEGAIILRAGRSVSGAAFSGGSIRFQGKRLNLVLEGRPDFEGVGYQFAGPWYDIEETPYQQLSNYFSGTAVVQQRTSEVILFQGLNLAGNALVTYNNGEQVWAVLKYILDEYDAQGEAAPFQIGTIEPAVPLNTYQTRDSKCSQIIEHCLRSSPNAVIWFDYTFTPPKVHCTLRENNTAVSVSVADGVKHEAISLIPRHDLQVRSVMLHFISDNADGETVWKQTTTQKYPLDGPEGGRRVLVQTIDLQGMKRTYLKGFLEASAVSNTRAWWAKYVAELATTKVRGFTFLSSMSVRDENGAAVSLSEFPNVLDDGAVAPWMELEDGDPVEAKQVEIMAEAAWTQWDREATGPNPETATNGKKVTVFQRKVLNVKKTVTNGITGDYQAVNEDVSAEAIPAGMAQAIYNALSLLQYEGTITLVEQECGATIGMGNALNLTGGRSEWTTMKGHIQTIRHNFSLGRTEITIGPAKHLSAGNLTELFLINRHRRNWVNPKSQLTAKNSVGGGLTAVKNAPKENTAGGVQEQSFASVSTPDGSNTFQVVMDSEGKEWRMETVNSSGSRVSDTGFVVVSMADLGTRALQLRWLYFKDAKNACVKKKALVLMTDPESATDWT